MNIYSISISHGKNSSHITYIRLNRPWSINRLRMKGLDWLREWLTAEREQPLNVKLKGKIGSVFVQVPRGEKPGFFTHTHTHMHIVILLYFGLCSTWKHWCFPLFETSCVSFCNRTFSSIDGRCEQVSPYPSSVAQPWWNVSFSLYRPYVLFLSSFVSVFFYTFTLCVPFLPSSSSCP